MPRLLWDQPQQRKYEAGINKGVLYPSDGPGVPWNGLVSVDETAVGGEVNSYYFDGVKYVDLVSPRNYQATLTAFSAPEEFSTSVGDKSVVPGFVLTRQARERFGLSYQTPYGGVDAGYKLHLIYNALASPTGRTHATIGQDATAEPMSWTIDAVPPVHNTYRPSAHYIFDSNEMDPAALDVIETLLYGSETVVPGLPTIEELLDISTDWETLIIIPESISGLAELVPGSGDLYRTTVAGLHRALPDTRLSPSPISGLYRME